MKKRDQHFALPLGALLLILLLPVLAGSQSIINKEVFKKIKIFNEKNINTPNLESSPAFMGDKVGIVFSDIKNNLFDKENGDPYYDLAYCSVYTDNALGTPTPWQKQINSDFHEGPMAYDAQKNILYFTRSHKERRRIKGVDQDTAYLRIMSADLNVAKPNVQPININAENFSVCHPALSADGNTLLFSSDKPGGQGKMDVYFAYFNGNEWSGILPAGQHINTPHHEIFPTLINDTILVFTSDRPGGTGGLDLYISRLEDGVWITPELLPPPFNSPYDDLGLIVRENARSGYFASNRPGGKGKDDIYRFESPSAIFGTEIREMVTTEIFVLDKFTLDGIPQAEIVLTPLTMDINQFTLSGYNVDLLSGKNADDLILKLSPKKGQPFSPVTCDESGNVKFQIKKNQKYLIKAMADGYALSSLIYDYDALGPVINMVMEPEDQDSTITDSDEPEANLRDSTGDIDTTPYDSTGVIILDNIYYLYNSSSIQPGAARELNQIAGWLIQKPEIRIRLESHTDSRGAAAYNLQLSIDRANAARKYLTDLGIDEDRITIKGYGESRLRNKCADGVPCTEAKHKFNRRTEVVIIK